MRVLDPVMLGSLDADAVDAAGEIARDIAETARRYAPRRTGRLRSSISAQGGGVTVKAPYASQIEYGSKSFIGRAIHEVRYRQADLFGR